jgi:tyrosinase
MYERRVLGPFPHGATSSLQRADLEFYGINHYRPSYLARIYFNDDEVDVVGATEDRESYAGSFAIFGHRECTGDEGHCDTHAHGRRFDDRPSHPLTRAFKRVVVTDALRRCLSSDQLTITVIAVTDPQDTVEPGVPLMDIDGVQLSTFE